MSAAHTCTRSALTQAFRSSSPRTTASWSVPEFLVPALASPARHSFSSGKCRPRESHSPICASAGHSQHSAAARYPPRATHERSNLRIPLPAPDARSDIEQWVAAIDPFLPPRLRWHPSSRPDESLSVTSHDLAWVLNAAQDASQDVIVYIGLVQRRWETVVWIVKKLVEEGKSAIEPPLHLEPFANVVWPETNTRSLNDLTNGALLTHRVRPSRKLKYTLDELTSAPDSIESRRIAIKQALGQLWRSLGNMILAGAEKPHDEGEQIMPHVLEIIAYLHHVGLIPDSVYTYRPSQDDHALQQPPTLHLLSSKILTALSDATWRAHEASVKVAKERMNASYFLGHEIPGSRYKVYVTGVAPELWLELVLWSCLHGGWILDGTAILEQMISSTAEHRWGLISWRELIQVEEQNIVTSSRGWSPFQNREDLAAKPEDRARTKRTISSEIVTAFIDGLVNQMRVGVGARGTNPEDVVEHIKKLKYYLDVNSLSLGSATWDSIMVRLLESGGIVPEERPELLLNILNLAAGFGSEVSAVNATSYKRPVNAEPPYFFEPTTIPLSLLHRAMRSCINNGDIAGAMATLRVLQQYTDNNKQKSLEQFFETLKSVSLQQNEPFTSRLPPIDFPAFDNQLPIPLLAKLLDLTTESGLYDLGRWLLLSEELDGPLIDRELYAHRSMAASIIRFGTMAGENDLVLKIVNDTAGGVGNMTQEQRMPAEVLTALICSQIRLRRWESISSMQQYVLDSSTYRPRPEILSTFTAELLRLSQESNDSDSSPKVRACNAFARLLFAWEDLFLKYLRNELYCILSILSTVDASWSQYCSQFLGFSSRQPIKLSTNDFNQVLSGVLDGYGSLKGKQIVDTWCYIPPTAFEQYRAPGGLPALPRFRLSRGEEYVSRPENIEIVQSSGARVILQGRVYANRQTVWAVLRKVQQEQDQRRMHGDQLTEAERKEVRETLKWAVKLLYHLGADYEDIVRDTHSLAEFAQMEAPQAPGVVGFSEGEKEQGC